MFGGFTPVIRDSFGARKHEAIASMEKIGLGGVEQWVVIRGHDRRNPILLYLHGGPGGSDFAPFRRWLPALEEWFTVVHWIQRGANKSYSETIPPGSMTVEQLTQDAVELARLMLNRFGQQKLFVVGQSLGTVMGMLMAQRCPELIHAYVGVNQILDRVAEERISYEYVLGLARKQGDQKAVADLERIGPPLDAGASSIDGIVVQRTWLRKFGKVTRDPKRALQWMMTTLFAAEFSWRDRFIFMKAMIWSMRQLWPHYVQYNFLEQVQELQVPVYLVGGREDHITNVGLAERFIARLKAPHKELVVFEQSGHIALFEEPELFERLMIFAVRKHKEAP